MKYAIIIRCKTPTAPTIKTQCDFTFTVHIWHSSDIRRSHLTVSPFLVPMSHCWSGCGVTKCVLQNESAFGWLSPSLRGPWSFRLSLAVMQIKWISVKVTESVFSVMGCCLAACLAFACLTSRDISASKNTAKTGLRLGLRWLERSQLNPFAALLLKCP